jgi:hypothetical protein
VLDQAKVGQKVLPKEAIEDCIADQAHLKNIHGQEYRAAVECHGDPKAAKHATACKSFEEEISREESHVSDREHGWFRGQAAKDEHHYAKGEWRRVWTGSKRRAPL